MGSRKRITSSLVVVCTLISISMGHSGSEPAPCDCDTINTIDNLVGQLRENILAGEEDCKNAPQPKYMDCAEVLHSGQNQSGVYTIWPRNRIIDGGVDVYCDMDTDGGGWTVIQRRGDYGQPEDNFYRDWDDYKRGFGSITEDHWLGNDNIYALTNQRRCAMRVDLGSWDYNQAYAFYNNCWIENEREQYRLHINGYSGDAGDAMKYHDNMKFSTRDRQNDESKRLNCSGVFKGGWWYKSCYYANLNGLYLKDETSYDGTTWWFWRYYESLKNASMKIRPTDFYSQF